MTQSLRSRVCAGRGEGVFPSPRGRGSLYTFYTLHSQPPRRCEEGPSYRSKSLLATGVATAATQASLFYPQ